MTYPGVRLREITDENRDAVCALRVRKHQRHFVASVATSLEDAADEPEENPWYRAVYAGDEPVGFVMLSLPDTDGRYYLMPMLDAWTNVFSSPGSRTTGNGPGQFGIVGPHWRDPLPDGVRKVRSPTNMAWIIGRVQASGPNDYEAARIVQDGLRLTPLSQLGRRERPPHPASVDPDVDLATKPVDQVSRMPPVVFFGMLAKLLVDNPCRAADQPMVDRMAG